MNKIITAGCMAVATFAAVAVPTKTELERAKPIVENMTKADLSAYKAGEKTAQKVALEHLVMAQKAEGEAANGTKLNYEVRGDGIVIGGVWKLAVPTNTTGALVIPETINGKPVCEIGMGAFANCRGITAVTIPSGVKTISAHAFRGCTGLESVTIPEGVTNIGSRAFWQCFGLKSVNIPSRVQNIGSGLFAQCGELSSVTMLGERPNAPNDALNDCPKLKEVHVPANAKSWAGMTEWQGKPLVFDAKADAVK